MTGSRIVAAAMQKGGVGKTTTTLNLARAASCQGHKVLVVDFDPQGNTTTTLAADDLSNDQLTIADAILPDDPVDLHEVIISTIWDGVSLAPALQNPLVKAERLISVSDHGREQRLRTALREARAQYDLILIDNAPALGQLLINALVAADLVFSVAEADEWSCDGLAELHNTVALAQHYYNPALHWSGILINKWRGTKVEEFWRDEITEKFTAAPVWTTIPLWASIKKTISQGQGLDESSEARLRVLANTYASLVEKLMEDR